MHVGAAAAKFGASHVPNIGECTTAPTINVAIFIAYHIEHGRLSIADTFS
jgi:hypothetical protein